MADPEDTDVDEPLDPGADLDKELETDWGGGESSTETTAPTVAPTSKAPAAPPSGGPQWAGEAFSVAGGVAPQWAGEAFSIAPTAKTTPKRSLAAEVDVGVRRSVQSLGEGLTDIGSAAWHKLAEITGSDYLKGVAANGDVRWATRKVQAEERLKPSVASVTDIKSAPDAVRYTLGAGGEMLGTVTEYATLGLPMMVIKGAMEHGVKTANDTDGDPAAVATGVAVGAALAGAPAPFLHGAAGQSFIQRVTKGVLGMGLIGAAAPYAEKLPEAVHRGSTAPLGDVTGAEVADSAAKGAIFGAGLGVVGGRRAPNTPDNTTPVVVPADHVAAMQLALPAPEPRQGLTYQPDRTQGEGFTTGQPQPMGTATANPIRPSDGLSRAEMVVALTQTPGTDVKVLRRMKTGHLQSVFDLAFPDRAKVPDVVEPEQLALPKPPMEMPDQSGDTLTQPTIEPQQARLEKPAIPLPDQTHPVDLAAAHTEPATPAQAEAGNYQKGRVRVQGLDVSIETPEGAIRKGPIDTATGEPAWQSEMPGHYGYIRGTIGADGDQLDVTLGPRAKQIHDATPEQAKDEPVFVVDQIDPKTGKFDEHKIFIGFHTDLEATRAYDASFSDGSGPSRRAAVTELPLNQFKDWAASGDTKAPLGKPITVGERLRRQMKSKMNPQAAPARSETFVAPPTTEPVATVGLVKREQAAAPRVSRMAREARAESEGQASVYEHETAGPTTVVEDAGVEKQRSPLTTNKDRVLGDLEQKVLNKEMSPADANKEYGVKEPGTGGRSRKHADFASYLRSRIAEAEDPQRQADIIDRAQRLQNDRTLTGDKRNAAAKALNNEISKTGKEYADQLREALHEIENPEQAAAERKQKQQAALDMLKRLTKPQQRSSMVRDLIDAVREPRLNRPIKDILERSHAAGTSAGLHEHLDAIINDSVIATRVPQLRALAQRLRNITKNIPVMSHEEAERRGYPVKHDYVGAYYTARPAISLNRDLHGTIAAETVTHEALHSVTSDYLESLPDHHPDMQALDAIHQELSNALDRAGLHETDPQRVDIEYALQDEHELHTMLMSNPRLQQFAAETIPSTEFRVRMRELGFPPQGSRSVWNAFTSWVRRIVGLPESGASLLDHILRPLQDITDRGAHASEFVMPRDATLRAVAEPVADVVTRGLPRLGNERADDMVDRAVAHIDPVGMGDRGRRLVLQGATTDGIVEWNRKLFESREKDAPGNTLENYRTASEAQAHASTEFRLRFADRVAGLLKRMATPERDALSSLMNDTTLADVRLGAGADNVHVKGREQVDALNALNKRYNALSPEGRKLYDDVRDYYRETYSRERRAQLTSMVKAALPEASAADIDTVVKQVRTMRGINELINDPDKTPVAAAFAHEWESNRRLVQQIAKAHRQGVVQGDYFPLRRYGDYVIHYGDKGSSDYGVEMFERRSQAEVRREELVKQGTEPSQVLDRRQSNLKSMLPTTVVDELDAALRHAKVGDADQVRDLFSSILLQHATRAEAARTRMRRQGVKGASTNAERTLSQDFLALTSRMGYLQHGVERSQSIAAMRQHADWLGRNGAPGEQIAAHAVVHELEQRMPSDDNSGFLTGVSRRFTNMGFLYVLLRPAHLAISTVDAHSNSTALLGARHGYARTTLALGKALKEGGPKTLAAGVRNSLNAVRGELQAVDWHMSDLVRDRFIAAGANKGHMIDLFHRLDAASLIDHTQVREIQRMARGNIDASQGWWDRTMNLVSASEHAVDVLNKAAIAKAAYDMELKKTGSHANAAAYAVDMTRKVMPNYNLHNKARVATPKGFLGVMSGPLTQFKQYGLHMYSIMGNLVKSSIHGASKQERNEARKAFAGLIATHSMMAGLATHMLADPLIWALGAYDWFTGADKPHNYENDLRNWMSDAFGPQLGEIVARGLPHMVGIDIHRSVKLSNMLELPEIRSFDSKGLVAAMAAAMTGASGEEATQIAAGLHEMLNGNMAKALPALMPRILRDQVQAYQLATKGVVDSRGRTEIKPEKIGAGAVAAKSLGFQPTVVSEFREGRAAVLEAKEETASVRNKAINKFVIAKSPSDNQSALAAVHAFNQAHPHAPITYSQLYEARKRELQGSKTPGSYGLTLPKKGARDMTLEGRFGAH